MSEEQFDAIIERLDGLQAEMETGFAAINSALSTILLGQTNLFNMLIGHTSDSRAHGAAS